MSLDEVGRIFLHSGFQVVAAAGTGTVLAYLFSELAVENPSTPQEVGAEFLEVVGQSALAALAGSYLFKALVSVAPERSDPASGLVFSMVLGMSMPQLQRRIKNLAGHARKAAGMQNAEDELPVKPQAPAIPLKNTQASRVGRSRQLA